MVSDARLKFNLAYKKLESQKDFPLRQLIDEARYQHVIGPVREFQQLIDFENTKEEEFSDQEIDDQKNECEQGLP